MAHGVKKIAYFRFYAELNDFLPYKKRQVSFAYHYWGTPSVKNAIQAQGVPHTEVDLVLVNGDAVDFSYHLRPQDLISVYPVFESLDIPSHNPLRGKPLRRLRFVVDANLGKLARYLRMLGMDTLYDNQFEDAEIIRLSNAENRVILTRDLGILKQNSVVKGYFLHSPDPKTQLAEVVRRFDLDAVISPFSRCMECNGSLDSIAKDKIKDALDDET